MREIKFRVWDNVESMFNFSLEDLVTNKIEFTSDCPVMQFTGLKDKNGKEIYEGDVINITGGEEHQGYRELTATGIVKYAGCTYCVVDKREVHYNMDLSPIDEIEIIGNIYENPEVLK